MNLETIQSILSQLSSMSTYLGGFSLVFLGAIITMSKGSTGTKTIIVASSLASTCFVLSAIGWGLMHTNSVAAFHEGLDPLETANTLFGSGRHKLLSLLFLGGQLSLFVCIAVSGFLHEQRTGRITMTVGGLGFFGLLYIMSPYVLFD